MKNDLQYKAGLGFRTHYYPHLLSREMDAPFFEIISENYMNSGGRPLAVLMNIRQDRPFAMHGVSLNIGSSDPINPAYLKKLKALDERVEAFVLSDHLCWTGAHSQNWHDLLPLPMTEASLQHICQRVQQVQETLGRQIALENISTYLKHKIDEMDEPTFVAEIAERSDSLILLDINNIYVNSKNHGFDPYQFLEKIPAKRVVQYHLAGHTDHGDFLFDTHDQAIKDEVWNLYRASLQLIGPRPTLIERDDNFPNPSELMAERKRAEKALQEFQGVA